MFHVAAPLIQIKGLSNPESLVLERKDTCVETRFINCIASRDVSSTRFGRKLGWAMLATRERGGKQAAVWV